MNALEHHIIKIHSEKDHNSEYRTGKVWILGRVIKNGKHSR